MPERNFVSKKRYYKLTQNLTKIVYKIDAFKNNENSHIATLIKGITFGHIIYKNRQSLYYSILLYTITKSFWFLQCFYEQDWIWFVPHWKKIAYSWLNAASVSLSS